MKKLSTNTVALLPETVELPGYDRKRHGVGIVHLGLGAFHRAHQAVYTDEALKVKGGDWRICGVSLCTPTAREQLLPQDCLFSVVEKSAGPSRYRLVGSIGEVIYAPEDRGKLIGILVDENVKIVSLTITEKGYVNDPATRRLNFEDEKIRRDVFNPEAPETAIGILVHALERRRSKGRPPFTLLSCDNLPENGKLMHNVLVDFAALSDDRLAQWIEKEVACPCTMVDRIVPAPTEQDREDYFSETGVYDQAMVVTEPFSQWVIEDAFPLGRPAWEVGGAVFSSAVHDFENMKLRLLNGAHSFLAYLGSLAGIATVSGCMQWPALKNLCARFMYDELRPTVCVPGGFDVMQYIEALLERFANPGLNHELRKIVMDGSQKLPPRWLEPVREQMSAGREIDLFCLGVAAWMRYACGLGDDGDAYEIRDPLAAEFTPLVVRFRENPDEVAMNLLRLTQIFGNDLHRNQYFCNRVKESFRDLCRSGARETILRRCNE